MGYDAFLSAGGFPARLHRARLQLDCHDHMTQLDTTRHKLSPPCNRMQGSCVGNCFPLLDDLCLCGTHTQEDRLLAPGWWPRKGSETRERYLGSAACADCHARIVDIQKTSPMISASMPANGSVFGRSGITSPLSFSTGTYKFEIALNAGGPAYSASDGTHSVSTSLGWAFGGGHFGQTYLYQQQGTFYESTLSYYPAIRGLDFTPGHTRSAPRSLAQALGEPQTLDTIRACFGCHTTAATTSNRFDPDHATPGVTCEACHGPGAQHVAAMSLANGNRSASFTFNPASLSPSDSVEFCGACHRTTLDAIETKIRGILTLRFPVYRLQASRCWGSDGDPRVTCVACHDPHRPLVTDTAAYDKNCLSCHRLVSTSTTPSQPVADRASAAPAKDHSGTACPVAQRDCVSCHMPKYNIPEMHADFTDHKIAIHQPGAPFKE